MKKETASRFSVSLPPSLLKQLDRMFGQRGYDNRSQAIADMIRSHLVEHRQKFGNEEIAGTITLVYRGDQGSVRQQLATTQQQFLKEVISSQHVFLEDDQSLEVLLVQGPAQRLEELCDALRCIRGVRQLQLVTTTALLPPLHEQDGSEAPAQKGKAA